MPSALLLAIVKFRHLQQTCPTRLSSFLWPSPYRMSVTFRSHPFKHLDVLTIIPSKVLWCQRAYWTSDNDNFYMEVGWGNSIVIRNIMRAPAHHLLVRRCLGQITIRSLSCRVIRHEEAFFNTEIWDFDITLWAKHSIPDREFKVTVTSLIRSAYYPIR